MSWVEEKAMLPVNIRSFLKQLRDPSMAPYSQMENGSTCVSNAHTYLFLKVSRTPRTRQER